MIFLHRIGLNISPHIVPKTIHTLEDCEKQLNCYGRSGLGLVHNMGQIGAFGPANFDEEFNNTFYVGASTISETGLSLVLLGSKLVVNRIDY
jgi:phytoene desaturase